MKKICGNFFLHQKYILVVLCLYFTTKSLYNLEAYYCLVCINPKSCKYITSWNVMCIAQHMNAVYDYFIKCIDIVLPLLMYFRIYVYLLLYHSLFLQINSYLWNKLLSVQKKWTQNSCFLNGSASNGNSEAHSYAIYLPYGVLNFMLLLEKASIEGTNTPEKWLWPKKQALQKCLIGYHKLSNFLI